MLRRTTEYVHPPIETVMSLIGEMYRMTSGMTMIRSATQRQLGSSTICHVGDTGSLDHLS